MRPKFCGRLFIIITLALGGMLLVSVVVVNGSTHAEKPKFLKSDTNVNNHNVFTGTAEVEDNGEFEETGFLNASRSGSTEILLPNDKVLITGGFVDDEDNRTLSELYDPTTGTFTLTGNLIYPRRRHSATLLPSGEVLIAGGWYGELATTTELYNPESGTFTTTGDLNYNRSRHSATLLPSGEVLIAGGTGDDYITTAEIYSPDHGTFRTTGDLNYPRVFHTATLLPGGEVLIAGGNFGRNYTPAELYNPATGTFTITGDLNYPRGRHSATLLQNGKVLIVGGNSSTYIAKIELYSPATGTFSIAGELEEKKRREHTATLLPNGKVLIVGGLFVDDDNDYHLLGAELYDPISEKSYRINDMRHAHAEHTATLLSNGKVLIAGGVAPNTAIKDAELFNLIPSNIFSATLILPSLINTNVSMVTFTGMAADAPVEYGYLSNDTNYWSGFDITQGETITTTWDFGEEGVNKPVYLRLRDVNGQDAQVITGTVSVDTSAPSSSMSNLPDTSPSAISLNWSGTDSISSVSNYDLQFRVGAVGEWTQVLTSTTLTNTTYNGVHGSIFYFRVRATDEAGNVEPWPDTFDTFTLVDTQAPTGTILINEDALATTSRNVTLSLAADDALGEVTRMRFSDNITTWEEWENYSNSTSYNLPIGDYLKTVYAQLHDEAGNISNIVSDTIRLDEAAGTDLLVSIDDGSIWTNSISVTLTVGAPAGTTQIQISNDGGLAGAVWQPFDTRPSWEIIPYGSYAIPRTVYVRVRNPDGIPSYVLSDDIIYDPVPPIGTIWIGSITSTTIQAFLNAYDPDNLSGLPYMRVSLSSDLDQVSWETYESNKTLALDGIPPSEAVVYAQFRDGAGNDSEIYSASTSSSRWLYLPLIVNQE